jgi:hypothetical protein
VKPITLPESAPADARARAAEFVLSMSDVASVTGVTKQAVYFWARDGRRQLNGEISNLPHIQEPGRKRAPLRFRWADLADFAAEQGIELNPFALPLQTQRLAKVGAYAPGFAFDPAAATEMISEAAAAEQLDVHRNNLARWRHAEQLNPQLRILVAADGRVRWNQADVHQVLDGKMPLRRDS